ncbi:MAG: fasciclin domain-containing protein [Aquificaceae bacterium]|nr:fasciclin domain-containing protein [Aquificaceae bacterium]MDW8032762.1 fasciclin domain-containing protein [Aquificaceae bacterium]MDW8294910.1 fasciclin domain-containing protein [Aquificaceae bacterium]
MLKAFLTKKALLGTAVFSFALGLAVAGMHERGEKKAGAGQAKQNIVQTAQQAGQFKTLLTALKEAGLEETLANKCCFTVFAPTDEAFGKIPKERLDALLKNKEALRKVLLYHVVDGKVYSKDLKEGQKVKTMQGQEATIGLKGGAKIDNASIVKTDIEASNGVIHVIDTVIMPR